MSRTSESVIQLTIHMHGALEGTLESPEIVMSAGVTVQDLIDRLDGDSEVWITTIDNEIAGVDHVLNDSEVIHIWKGLEGG